MDVNGQWENSTDENMVENVNPKVNGSNVNDNFSKDKGNT